MPDDTENGVPDDQQRDEAADRRRQDHAQPRVMNGNLKLP